MNIQVYQELKLEVGELIYIMNEKGEGITGIFENEYDSSNETFRFRNYSNGQIETIKIKKLQFLKRC